MKGDIGMANHEEQVEQEAAYPIPISLYNCYRTVRHDQEYSYASLLMPHCPVTVVQTYRDGVCSLLFKDGSQPVKSNIDRAVHPHYATQRSNI